MTTLADRVEAAGVGSRELDCLIAVAINLRLPDHGISAQKSLDIWGLEGFAEKADSRQNIWSSALPRYTASIDAALTLAPDGWKLRQMNFSAPCADDRKWHLNLHGGTVGQDTFVGRGATPALALCAAALRARQTSGL